MHAKEGIRGSALSQSIVVLECRCVAYGCIARDRFVRRLGSLVKGHAILRNARILGRRDIFLDAQKLVTCLLANKAAASRAALGGV